MHAKHHTEPIETEPIRVDTEPIFSLLEHYRTELLQHPLLEAARRGELPRDILLAFAYHQYSDSITWIPMLAQMRSKAVRSRRLRDAITDNIGHEAGLARTSHVTLAASLMKSLGITRIDGFATHTFVDMANEWLSGEFAAFGEPEVAGWLLVAESLVPLMFAAVAPAYARLGCDITYFTEHIAVDADEHATWMAESVREVATLYGGNAIERIIEGMTDAWTEALVAPDELWRRLLLERSQAGPSV
jgi:hypothetical protein